MYHFRFSNDFFMILLSFFCGCFSSFVVVCLFYKIYQAFANEILLEGHDIEH